MTHRLEPNADGDSRDHAEHVFEQALALPPEARAAYLDEACRGNEPMRRELASLLEHAPAAERLFTRLGDLVTSSQLGPVLTIGRYEILGCIGVGGMGAVYRARDTQLQRDVALKFLPAHVRAPHGADEQLLVEARMGAALEHANVCTVHEIGVTDDGRSFIAMAFYDGETLRDRLRRGPVGLADAVEITRQVARGLGAAHARGIVHRDVKPGNIMLTADGTVKLLDFGLAAVADTQAARDRATPGTAAYMSPEHAAGGSVSARSDLWSVGVVFYEMLAGVQPFRAESSAAVKRAIQEQDPVPLSRVQPDVPEALQRIVSRLLEKKPEARYANTAELLAVLDRASAAPAPAPAPGRAAVVRRRPRKRLAVLGALVVVLAGVALWRVVREPTATPAANAANADVSLAGAVAADGVRSVAVLPFTNVRPVVGEDYVADGLTEELTVALSRVQTLQVAPPTSAAAFRSEPRDVVEIGRTLHVTTILQGTVEQVGDGLRVRAELRDARTGSRLWSGTYERRSSNLLEIQTDVATRIAVALRAELTTAEWDRLRQGPTASPEAFSLYLKGRHFGEQRTAAAYQRAVEYFQRAIEADPRYAAPHAGLAAVYSQLGMAGGLSSEESRRRTRASAEAALAIDDGFAEAHSLLAVYLHAFERNAAAAEREHLRAVALEPRNPTVLNRYGNFLRSVGRVDEAVAQQTRAVELDPLAPALGETLAFTLLRAGRTAEAERHVREVIELDSTFWRAHAVLGNVYEQEGRYDDAIRAFERAEALAGARNHRTQADVARVLARMGRVREARELVSRLREEAERMGAWDPAAATAFLALGEVDAAHAWLEELYRRRHPDLAYVGGDPRFAPFDHDPTFIELMGRYGWTPP